MIDRETNDTLIQFDGMIPEQESLAIKFCSQISGLQGHQPSFPDAVRLLEMAEALFLAELRSKRLAVVPREATAKMAHAGVVATEPLCFVDHEWIAMEALLTHKQAQFVWSAMIKAAGEK